MSTASRERLYDDYLYDDLPVTEAHPARVAAIARLFGVAPAPPDRCRVLELGSGLGGNLVALASVLPGSRFVGVDGSARQIAAGQADADALGLGNVTLLAMDILDVDASLGVFDYVVCHGVYSWVPPAVQAKILGICGAQLAPEGVAYVSFNTYPGWHLRGMIRDALRRGVDRAAAPEAQVREARELLRFLALAPEAGSPARAWLARELSLLEGLSDRYLFYEYLVDVNTPVYFADFAAAAAGAGLAYLSDVHLQTMAQGRFGAEAAAAISRRSRSVVDTEQHIDLLDLRFFRRALLCREAVPVERALSGERLEDLWVGSPFEPASASPDLGEGAREVFVRAPGVELTTAAPLTKAALVALAGERPRGLPFPALFERAAALLDGRTPSAEDRARLGDDLLEIFARGHLELSAWPYPCGTRPGPRPSAGALARLQASRGRAACTNLRHESVRTDTVDRALLRRMDGTRTAEDLAEGVIDDAVAGAVSIELNGEPTTDREVIAEVVEKKILRLAQQGFLTA